MELDIQQILTQIVAFLIMVWILKKFAWKPLLNLMDERKKLIQSEFDSIKEQKEEVDQMKHAYQAKLDAADAEGRAKIQAAVVKGREAAQQIEKEARQRASAILNRSQEEVEQEISLAKNQLKNDMVNMSLLATEKLIQESLDPKKHQKLIEEALEQADFR